jgi:hypothetical protein
VVENPIENGAIDEIIEDAFEPGKETPPKAGCVNPRLSNALYPIRQLTFPVYEEDKQEITCLNDAHFADSLKKWFLRIFAYKLNVLWKAKDGEANGFKYKILRGELASAEIQNAKRWEDPEWLNFINVTRDAEILFTDNLKYAPKAGKNQVVAKQDA